MTKRKYTITRVIVSIIAAVITLLIINSLFLFSSVVSRSMNPTYDIDDIVVVARWKTPKRGDVVFFDGIDEDRITVKRCIALGGDRVRMEGGTVYINDEPLVEDYVLDEPPLFGDHEELVVPEGCMYVLGDNRNNSKDSRMFGCVPINRVIGVPIGSF